MAISVTVTLKDAEAPITVPILNPDRVRWDMTRQKHKWPAFDEAAFLGSTFLAWAALRREGIYGGTFEQFRDHDALEVETFDPDEDTEGDTLGDPTN